MSIKNFLLYTVVIAISGALAWAVVEKVRSRTGPELDSEAIDDPLWYHDAPMEAVLAGAQRRLDSMTSMSVAANTIGPMKDDLALLCRFERVVDLIVESYRKRKELGPVEQSAYMEIFSRVRHDKFAPLLLEGLKQSRFEPRMNAVEAAILHGHPDTIPLLARALDEGGHGYEGSKIIAALSAIGTDEALAVIDRQIDSNDPLLVTHAIRAAITGQYRGALARIKKHIDHDDPTIRAAAAWGMAAAGLSEGRGVLTKIVKDFRLADTVRAQAVQFLISVAGAECLGTLREISDLETAAGFEARIGRAVHREKEFLEELRRDLVSDDEIAHRGAVAVLACTGFEEDVKLLGANLDRIEGASADVLVQSIGRGGAPGAANLVVELSRRGDEELERKAVGSLVTLGEQGLDALARIVKDSPSRACLGHSIATLGGFKSQRAIDILRSIDVGNDRRLWLFLRNSIKRVELEMLKVAERS